MLKCQEKSVFLLVSGPRRSSSPQRPGHELRRHRERHQRPRREGQAQSGTCHVTQVNLFRALAGPDPIKIFSG